MDTFQFRAFSYDLSPVPVAELNDVTDYHELTICIKGKLFYTVDGTPFAMAEGDCIYLPPQSRRFRAPDDTPTAYFSINLFGQNERIFSQTIFQNVLDGNLLQVIEWMQKAYITRNYEKVILLAQYLFSDLREKLDQRKYKPVVWKIKRFILENIDKKITLKQISSHVFLSKEYCEALFKKETGTTIVRFINEEKVTAAKNMILLDEYALTQIAEKLGFDDYNYFSRVFKRHAGVSPLSFRKLQSTRKNSTV